ncbi:FAD-binding domain-containing protein [Mytilinidion resinicola]|uniref:FAD-binding domain-containing protein n=1 Tax=Mytilinidion resinicola TaxID=574789 RepID=A0A6A6YRP6_9PEZI|nr:FAD-binding domain-containing protein [Mytilinidion resinicola]KAF2810577.1 FAD-binding domain-containing protein [Mytilinidion resinicola]
MGYTSTLLLGLLSLGSVASAIPAPSVKASTDASCGGSTGYTCAGSTFGSCCSAYGWCGSTDAYCGPGCQSGFGKCGSDPSTPSSTSTAPISSTSATTASSTPSSSSPASLSDCLNDKNVPISLASSPNFQQLSAPYNQRLPYTPAVIVIPTTQQHIQDAVVCAGKSNVKVQAKSGGHSYASFSSGGKDGSMVIDLENFHDIELDTTTGTVTVGAGVRLGNLAQGIWDQGKRALPHGTCPGVGIGGHSTHGGYGYDSRLWGLAMDTIIALDVVLADGSVAHATSTEHSDIFWAMRGAGDSFGVVVTFYMQTQPAPEAVTFFQYSFSVFGSQETFTDTFLHLQDFATNSSVIDARIGFGVYLDGSGFSLTGTFIGSIDEYNDKIAPELLRSLPTPSSPTVQSMDWISSLVKLSNEPSLSVPLTGYSAHDNFFAKSITVPESTGLTVDALNSYYTYIHSTSAPASWFSIINLYGGPESAINSKDTSFAAYSDRNSLWVFQHYGETEASVPYIQGLNDAVTNAQPQTKFGAYLNYVDPSLSAADAHTLYYGDEVYGRLAALKKTADPNAVFWNPQAIGA